MVFRATRNKSPNFFSKSPVHVCPAGWSGTALCALTRPPVRGLAAAVQPPSTPPPPSPFREGKTDWIPVLLRCHVPQGTQKLRDSLSTSLHGCTQSFSFPQFSAPLRLTQNVYDSFFPSFFFSVSFLWASIFFCSVSWSESHYRFLQDAAPKRPGRQCRGRAEEKEPVQTLRKLPTILLVLLLKWRKPLTSQLITSGSEL